MSGHLSSVNKSSVDLHAYILSQYEVAVLPKLSLSCHLKKNHIPVSLSQYPSEYTFFNVKGKIDKNNLTF